MEEILCKSTASETPLGTVSLSVDTEDIFSSRDISPVEERNIEKNIEGETSEAVNGNNNDSMSPKATEKTFSPTLIESAFKVMKNLFSPDKTKGKSVGILSPITQSKSASGSPRSSIFIPGKPEIFSLDLETDVFNNLQSTSGGNSLRKQSQNNDSQQSPLILDPFNNTDESFLTTVSLIDESFHSAVTHLDEHGDALKNGPILMNDTLNTSQNLDLIDPYNDTLETNDSCLENTTLKIGSITSEGSKFFLAQNKDGSGESLINAQNFHGDGSLNFGLTEDEFVALEKNRRSSLVENENFKNEFTEILAKNSPKSDVVQHLTSRNHLNHTAAMSPNICLKPINTEENKEISDLLLSKSSDKSKLTENSKNCFDSDKSEGNTEKLNTSNNNLVHKQEISAENSISTTTVVLSTVDSVDLENMLIALKEDDSGTTSSLTSFEGDDVNFSLEILTEKTQLKAPNLSPFSKQLLDSYSETKTNFFPVTEERKNSVSEGNSTNIKLDCHKLKLNKSDEFISGRFSSSSSETKRGGHETRKSLVNISLMKNTEASEISTESQFTKDFNQSQSEKSVGDLIFNQANPVVSQQSYTILASHNDSLNRPVIESLNVSGFSDKEMSLSGAKVSGKSRNLEKSSNGSFDSENLTDSSQIKQSTPLWEANNESNQKFLRPNSLKLFTSENKEFVCSEKEDIEKNYTKQDLLGFAKQIFSTNEASDEISPVNPIRNKELILSNSVESEYNVNTTKILLSQKRDVLNETFDKRSVSPEPKNMKQTPEIYTEQKLNHTFEKNKSFGSNKPDQTFVKQSHTLDQNELNITFDKNQIYEKTVSLVVEQTNQTFTKELKSLESDQANQTFDVLESVQLNKTYNKRLSSNILNQTFEKQTNIEHQTLNETFDKKPEFSSFNKIAKGLNGTSESHCNNKTDVTFVKETDSKNPCQENIEQEVNNEGVNRCESEGKETFEKNTGADTLLSLANSHQSSSSGATAPESFEYRTNTNVIELCSNKDFNESLISTKSSNTSLTCGDLSTVLLNEGELPGNKSIDDLSGKLEKMSLSENSKQSCDIRTDASNLMLPDCAPIFAEALEGQNLQSEEKSLNPLKDEKLDTDLVQLIQEQFSSNDIEKICSVVHDLSSMKLTNDILKASEQFDKSFHGNFPDAEFKPPETEMKLDKMVNPLSPQSLEFLNSIRGKPTGRDLSRESLYVKFDPLVQPSANSLIDFTKEGEALSTTDSSPVNSLSTSICEKLLTISPQKKPDEIVPPLTPLSHRAKTDVNLDKSERLKELQNEIYFLKNLYAERERLNKTKMEDYENQIAKLTGESCMLEDKLKESNEREKSLVKKVKEQTQNISQLKIIMEEYVKVISKLTAELETTKTENQKQIESLSHEKDSYMTHLQNTEAAFTDVHAKYEKSKKTIISLKTNEAMYRNTIAEQAQKLEDFKVKAREAQEKAVTGFQKLQEELSETKANHTQEAARLRAQLRKTELKVEALQDSLDQKIKENQQLTAICDELIEGKK